VRIVISARDPGVVNWLDTAGVARGVALLRWYFTSAYPAPAAPARALRRARLAAPRRDAARDGRRAPPPIAARRAVLQRRYGQ